MPPARTGPGPCVSGSGYRFFAAVIPTVSCSANSPGDPSNVDKDRGRRGHEAEQKCPCALHRWPLATDRKSQPDVEDTGRDRGFDRGGSEHEHKGGTALCSMMDD
jgi:hypothetical protein